MSMAIVYRDYGAVNGQSYVNSAVNTVARRQVFQATHRGDGSRLPLMNRSFISFTYGGKHIEDFDLLATISGDRLSRPGYANFEDTVTTYENLDGQFYWSTHYRTNQLDLVLSTDGIRQDMLDEFLYWFQAGVKRELILAEHPNRAIVARVAQPPQLELLPFEHEVYVNLSDEQYKTKTTLYKGDIQLSLVMDEPHWYAVKNILGIIDEENNRYVDQWIDETGAIVDIFASADALKVLQEDGIPLGSTIENNMILGNGIYADVETNVNSRIWSIPDEEITAPYGEPLGEGARIDGYIYLKDTVVNLPLFEVCDHDGNLLPAYIIENGQIIQLGYVKTSRLLVVSEDYEMITTENEDQIMYDKDPGFVPDMREYNYGHHEGRIAGAIVDISGNGIEKLEPDSAGYFFYAGTAPSPTKITFTVDEYFDENSNWIVAPNNTYSNPDRPYNLITITSRNQQSLRFTTPSLFTSYNKTIDIFIKYMNSEHSWEDIFDTIRDTVRHAAIRAWAAYVVTGLKQQYGGTTANSGALLDAIQTMKKIFLDDDGNTLPVTFFFDSKTGEAVGYFQYRKPTMGITYGKYFLKKNAGTMILNLRDTTISAKRRWNYLVDQISEAKALEYSAAAGQRSDYSTLTKYRAAQITAFLEEYDRRFEANEAMEPIYIINFQVESTSNIIESVEDVGDMLESNYLTIRDRNYPDNHGKIVAWNDETEIGKTWSHKITHDLEVPISNLQIEYKYMYL